MSNLESKNVQPDIILGPFDVTPAYVGKYLAVNEWLVERPEETETEVVMDFGRFFGSPRSETRAARENTGRPVLVLAVNHPFVVGLALANPGNGLKGWKHTMIDLRGVVSLLPLTEEFVKSAMLSAGENAILKRLLPPREPAGKDNFQGEEDAQGLVGLGALPPGLLSLFSDIGLDISAMEQGPPPPVPKDQHPPSDDEDSAGPDLARIV